MLIFRKFSSGARNRSMKTHGDGNSTTAHVGTITPLTSSEWKRSLGARELRRHASTSEKGIGRARGGGTFSLFVSRYQPLTARMTSFRGINGDSCGQ